jgi:mannose-6-phosphate isomerase-like protein (cupin superfamily)
VLIRNDESTWFDDGPDRGRILLSGRDTHGAYSVMQWILASSSLESTMAHLEYGPHRHADIEETFLITSGTMEFLIGQTVETLRSGDCVRVSPGERHGFLNRSGEDAEMVVIFSPGGFEELFVKYRSDQPAATVGGEGFAADASRFFGTEFEV